MESTTQKIMNMIIKIKSQIQKLSKKFKVIITGITEEYYKILLHKIQLGKIQLGKIRLGKMRLGKIRLGKIHLLII